MMLPDFMSNLLKGFVSFKLSLLVRSDGSPHAEMMQRACRWTKHTGWPTGCQDDTIMYIRERENQNYGNGNVRETARDMCDGPMKRILTWSAEGVKRAGFLPPFHPSACVFF
jgi:hypothetical protein